VSPTRTTTKREPNSKFKTPQPDAIREWVV
jgi:hypothetical protein